MDLADRIRERMSALRLTQEALANRAEVSQALVYKLLARKSKGTTKLVGLAEALECSIEWLATGNEEQSSASVQELPENYGPHDSQYIAKLKERLQALSSEDQKRIAMEIMDELMSPNADN